jgi:hypothetical protein
VGYLRPLKRGKGKSKDLDVVASQKRAKATGSVLVCHAVVEMSVKLHASRITAWGVIRPSVKERKKKKSKE